MHTTKIRSISILIYCKILLLSCLIYAGRRASDIIKNIDLLFYYYTCTIEHLLIISSAFLCAGIKPCLNSLKTLKNPLYIAYKMGNIFCCKHIYNIKIFLSLETLQWSWFGVGTLGSAGLEGPALVSYQDIWSRNKAVWIGCQSTVEAVGPAD